MVPFRDSALTHVLKDSLSGNCKTTLVTAASPHKFNIVETISTFRFGSRCKLVKTKAEKNVVLSPAQMRKMIASLKTEIKSLKMQVLKGGGGGGMLYRPHNRSYMYTQNLFSGLKQPSTCYSQSNSA